jgi:hypothetical protein
MPSVLCLRQIPLDTRCGNKVRELATVCLPWWQWTKTSVWFDDVGISATQSCVVVVDLWPSVYEWRLLLSECAVARMSELELEQRTNLNFFLILARVETKSERCWCQFTGIFSVPKDKGYIEMRAF